MTDIHDLPEPTDEEARRYLDPEPRPAPSATDRTELRDGLARALEPDSWKLADDPRYADLPQQAQDILVRRSRDLADRALTWFAEQRVAGGDWQPDLTEPVEAAAQAMWGEVMSDTGAGALGAPAWETLDDLTRRRVRESVLPAVAAAAPLIAGQVRAERLWEDL